MRAELYEAMMKTVDTEKLASAVPAELIAAVKGHGLHKVAAALMGIPEITETTAAMYIGRKLASRRAETQTINSGLVALAALEK